MRELLEEMSRPMLYAMARKLAVKIYASTPKDELIDALAPVSAPWLRDGLAATALPDLRALCKRLGYAATGNEFMLAARLVLAVDQPDARLSRWRSFAEARSFARNLNLRAQSEWYALARGRLPRRARLPADIPNSPHAAYAESGWISWADFLGTENTARQTIEYRPFARARAYVRSLGLANASEWKRFASRMNGNRHVRPADIPATPERVYAAKGWVSYGDWLGNGRVHGSKIRYRSYIGARRFVRALRIQTEPEWQAYCRGEIHRSKPRPLDVPSNPHRTYKGAGWVSWGKFLGTNSVALYNRTFRTYEAARAYVRSRGVTTSKEWRVWCAKGSRPSDIPGAPDIVYRGRGWISWPHFLRAVDDSTSEADGRRAVRQPHLRSMSG